MPALIVSDGHLGLTKAIEAWPHAHVKWKKLCPPVARSLEEAGEKLLTFYAFPKPLTCRLASNLRASMCTMLAK